MGIKPERNMHFPARRKEVNGNVVIRITHVWAYRTSTHDKKLNFLKVRKGVGNISSLSTKCFVITAPVDSRTRRKRGATKTAKICSHILTKYILKQQQ